MEKAIVDELKSIREVQNRQGDALLLLLLYLLFHNRLRGFNKVHWLGEDLSLNLWFIYCFFLSLLHRFALRLTIRCLYRFLNRFACCLLPFDLFGLFRYFTFIYFHHFSPKD